MTYQRILLFCLSLGILFFPCVAHADGGVIAIKKTMQTQRISTPPKIDGKLDDAAWVDIAVISDFLQDDPDPGKPQTYKTDVKVIYDDQAIYVAARMYDVSKDSILKELTKRDEEGNSDLFAVFFDTFHDEINALGFGVTSAGVQLDAKYSSQGEDFSWNAVWESELTFLDDGWAVEMKIPYSALRFSNQETQVWGVNFYRSIRRLRESAFWNFNDPKADGFARHFGNLEGIKGIEPPLRLAFYPYISTTLEHYPYNTPGLRNTSRSINGGMDVKYGISKSFTLDMTLIPDFGQVQSDNQVLNLSPFETRFDENRSFFMEGTELFSKAGIFYSRRVGGRPIGFYKAYGEAKEGETVIKNPGESQLANATKISGRTPGGLGIGFFNATSLPTYATIRDSEGSDREFLTAPLTNYNIIVFDQSLKRNSYISFINTNVLRNGAATDADVTGTEFRLNNKTNKYFVLGSAALSHKYGPLTEKPSTGHTYFVKLGKSSGNFRWDVFNNVESDTYNPNDLGFLFNNNENTYNGWMEYRSYEPKGKFNTWAVNANINYARLYAPSTFQNFGINAEVWARTRKHLAFGVWTYLEPVITYDFFEARIPGRFYTYPTNTNWGGWISTDYRKKFAIDLNANMRIFDDRDRYRFNFDVQPRFRASDKLSFIYAIGSYNAHSDVGFADIENDTVYFGYRDLNTLTHTFTNKYIFNNRMSLSLRLRHYWAKAVYKDFLMLGEDGYIRKNTASHEFTERNGQDAYDINFNAFNVDLVYTWQFAPGSELTIVWKNSILSNSNEVINSIYDNFQRTWDSPQTNNLSFKLLYYIDYLSLKKKGNVTGS